MRGMTKNLGGMKSISVNGQEMAILQLIHLGGDVRHVVRAPLSLSHTNVRRYDNDGGGDHDVCHIFPSKK